MRHDEAAQDEEKINGKVGSAEDREEIEQACLGQTSVPGAEKKWRNGTPSPR
jgi:hypothetical protein